MERMATILLLFVSVNVLTTSFMVGTRGSFPSRYFSTSTVTKGSMTVLHSSITEAMGRSDFPILETDAHPGKKLIFLDSAASSQKPHYVLNAMDNYYKTSHANVHRGAHALAVKATEAYENAREHVRKFVNAGGREEIIFTRGATDAINLVALSWTQRLQPGDEIILTEMEHHSNLVPWQMAAQRTGAILKFVHMNASMEFNLDEYYSLLSPKTKLVAVAHASNVLGTLNPVKQIIAAAHAHGALVLLDACQSVPHMPVDVKELDVDFLAASGHKMCGPTGIGFLYGRKDLLNGMPPVVGGGEMIDKVELQGSTYALSPSRFEAGTPPIAEAVGLGAACEYLTKMGMDNIYAHEVALGTYLYQQLSMIESLTLYGPSPGDKDISHAKRTGLVAFNCKTVHATDLSFFLDQEGVAVRTGHHCTQPLHAALGAAGSVRASLYFYNNQEDVDIFIVKLKDTIKMFESMG